MVIFARERNRPALSNALARAGSVSANAAARSLSPSGKRNEDRGVGKELQPALHDRLEHGLRVGGRTADHPENFSSRSLLMQCLVALAGKRGGCVFGCGARFGAPSRSCGPCSWQTQGAAVSPAVHFHRAAAWPPPSRQCAILRKTGDCYHGMAHLGRVAGVARPSISAHPRESGDPGNNSALLWPWIPAFAGMSGGCGTLAPRNDGRKSHRPAPSSSSRSLKRWILPVAVRGSASRASIQRGNFHGPALSLTWCLSVSSRPSSAL